MDLEGNEAKGRASQNEEPEKKRGRGRREVATHLDSKSKILIPEAVAAQSQYRLGEKTRALTMSPASRE